MDTITGEWTGKYIYGDSYEEELRGRSVPFFMKLFFDGEFIKGTCIDEETNGIFSEPAKIEGTFENNTILYYKSYPDPQGLVGPSLLIAKEYNSTTSIQYTGVLKKKLFSRTRYFEGTWEIHGSFLDKDGIARYYTLDGTWKMEKV